jgi:hypothetical protein
MQETPMEDAQVQAGPNYGPPCWHSFSQLGRLRAELWLRGGSQLWSSDHA